MSKLETPLIREYWRRVGGTLVEEFPAVTQSSTCGYRLLDAVILPKGERRIARWRDVSLEDQDVIVVQAKAMRLGMYLMGQAVFSAELIKRFRPASVKSVLICSRDDSVLRPLLEAFPHVEVVVLSGIPQAAEPEAIDVRAGSTRVDTSGRAFAGSQRQIQLYVNQRAEALNRAICRATAGTIDEATTRFEWVSPIETDGFREYRDGEALRLGLAHLARELATFWPARGPRRDALAKITTGEAPGIVLIEGKSYPREMFSGGSRAGEASQATIARALGEAQAWLNVSPDVDWLGAHYQSANRLAHLYFFRRHGVSAWLANVGFVDDDGPRRASLGQWQRALPVIKHGLFGQAAGSSTPYAVDILLPAVSRAERASETSPDPTGVADGAGA